MKIFWKVLVNNQINGDFCFKFFFSRETLEDPYNAGWEMVDGTLRVLPHLARGKIKK